MYFRAGGSGSNEERNVMSPFERPERTGFHSQVKASEKHHRKHLISRFFAAFLGNAMKISQRSGGHPGGAATSLRRSDRTNHSNLSGPRRKYGDISGEEF